MSAPNVSNRPTYTLTARAYAFWLWGMFASGAIIGGSLGAWFW